ncbi:hypothetical protein CES86_3701 [Brucella lupini]|uniref:Uncharacterized protein n=1 Tax=Brucella lupini TaxID=255457 RepID=A0A256GGI7_9HYPH|nr:hypothetical protein CES86_3701 [Brucella lupini]
MAAILRVSAQPSKPIQSKPKLITTAWLARELEKVLTEAFPGDLNV